MSKNKCEERSREESLAFHSSRDSSTRSGLGKSDIEILAGLIDEQHFNPSSTFGASSATSQLAGAAESYS